MNQIAIIVVTYNRKELLKKCLGALLKQTVGMADIIVIDNASTDETRKYIDTECEDERVRYIRLKKNIGGAGGFNVGLKKAMDQGYEYFWLMDDDSIPEDDALEKILSADEVLDHNYGFLCSNVIWIDGNPCKMNIPDISNKWIEDSGFIDKGLLRVDRATFVGFFTRREVVERIGYPIKDFFIWADDSNYSFRINEYYPSYFVSGSVIVHEMKNNQPAYIVDDSSGRYDRYFYAYRNRRYNAKKQNKLKEYRNVFLKTLLKVILKGNDKTVKLKYMLKGYIAGIFFDPKIEK